MGDGLEGYGEDVDGVKEVGGKAGDGKVALLFLLLCGIALEVEEVGLEVLEARLGNCWVTRPQ